MLGIVAGKRSRGKPRLEKYITNTFGTKAAGSRVAGYRHNFRRHQGSDVLTRICSQKKTCHTGADQHNIL